MARKKLENYAPSARNLEIYKQVIDGASLKEVAEKHGVCFQRVYQIKEAVDAWFRPQLTGEIARIREEQTKLLMIAFNEAMEGWERSKADAEIITYKHGPKGGKPAKPAERTVKGQAGDPRFLEAAMRALADIRKIWGADAKDKDLGEPAPEALQAHVSQMSDAELRAVAGLKRFLPSDPSAN